MKNYNRIKLTVFLFLVTIIIVSCKKEDSLSVCGCNESLLELEWLSRLKADLKGNANIYSAEISLYRLNDVDYIYVQESVSSSYDLPSTIYDCEGNEKYKCGGNQPVDSCSNFFSKAQKIKILWEK
ncbi:MAG: hypothetical protein M0P26_04425 [Bacteroidales bacterium]|nr:hypothetical protein [Bacteroidales bacterium]